ncbi:MAG TPA: general stress protein [Micromonosporaceae bacterium]|nr:general stress protein [Micromonosporaceae bacterium]
MTEPMTPGRAAAADEPVRADAQPTRAEPDRLRPEADPVPSGDRPVPTAATPAALRPQPNRRHVDRRALNRRLPDREAQLAATTPVASFRDYADAEGAVHQLAEAGFPIEQITIVGSDVRIVEAVTGRLTAVRAAGLGALSGAWMGVLVALLFAIFSESVRSFVAVLLWGLVLGAVFGAVLGLLGYTVLDRTRGFTSNRLVLAGRYDLHAAHETAQQLRDQLLQLEPAGMRIADHRAPASARPDATTFPDTDIAE